MSMSTPSTPVKPTLLGFVVWLLAIFFFLYEFALRTILGTFTHQIIPALHLTPFTYSVMDSSYSASFIILAIPVGLLVDKVGIRWTITSAMAILAIATLWYSHADSFAEGLMSRLLMGVGSSLSFVSVVVIIMMWFPRRMFAFLVGLSQFIATFGPMLGGGPLIYYIHHAHETWRLGLRDIAYVGFVVSFLMLLFVREKKRSKLQEAYYIQGVGHILKYLKELFKHKQVWYTVLYTGLSYAGFQVICTIWGVEYLQAQGLSQQLAANCISFAWVGYAIACPLLGVLSDMTQQRKFGMCLCVGLGFIASIVGFYLGHLHYLAYLFVFFTLGVAASGQNLSFVLLAEKVSTHIKATATAFNNSMISVFVVAFTMLSSGFINHAVHGNIAKVTGQDFKWAFIIIPLSFLVAFFISLGGIREKAPWFKNLTE